ncbi:MAG: radical SAM protein [Thermodesulfobacteriota bacterium]|nr:radical SAM protein [Thermodesulfobacteriota bacterium]
MEIRYLILLLTDWCNLNCAYCYRGIPPDAKDMSIDLLETSLMQLVPLKTPCHVQLSGGEPTIVPDLIEKASKTLQKKRPHATLGIQTNGTMLDRSLARLFAKYRIQVGVSLDGPLNIQERLRGNASSTVKGLKLLEAENVPFRVTTVISNTTIDFLDKLVLMLGGFSNAQGIGLDLLIHKGNATSSERVLPATLKQTTEGIKRMIDALRLVNRDRRMKLEFREEKTIINAFKGKRPTYFCYAGASESLAVCPDGSLYPCSQTADDPRFFMGTLNKPHVAPTTLINEFRLSLEDCGDCPLTGRCPGDCYSRQYYNDSKSRRLICAIYQTIINIRKVK